MPLKNMYSRIISNNSNLNSHIKDNQSRLVDSIRDSLKISDIELILTYLRRVISETNFVLPKLGDEIRGSSTPDYFTDYFRYGAPMHIDPIPYHDSTGLVDIQLKPDSVAMTYTDVLKEKRDIGSFDIDERHYKDIYYIAERLYYSIMDKDLPF